MYRKMNRNRITVYATIAAALTLVAGLALAAGEDIMKEQALREETAKAEADLCQDLTTLATALGPIDTLTANTRVQEVRSIRSRADKEIKEVKRSVSRLEDSRLKELEAAYERFKKSVESLPGDATLGTAAPALTEEAKAIHVARERYNTPLNCRKEGAVRPGASGR